MNNLDENNQTAFFTAGIPAGEKDAAATDSINEAVEAIMDNVEKEATGEIDAERNQSKSN